MRKIIKIVLLIFLCFSIMKPTQARAEFVTSSFVIGVVVGIITVEVSNCYYNKENNIKNDDENLICKILP